MSSQRGNVARSRPQKHKNKTVFKNNLHDTSNSTKQINKIEINNVCERCKSILEWKIKYKKYKLMKAPSTCVICHMKTVKHAYHTMCSACALKTNVCPKCGKETKLVLSSASFDEAILKTAEVQGNLKKISERKRRAFNRFVKKVLAADTDALEKSAEVTIMLKLKELVLHSEEINDSDSYFDDDEEDEGDESD